MTRLIRVYLFSGKNCFKKIVAVSLSQRNQRKTCGTQSRCGEKKICKAQFMVPRLTSNAFACLTENYLRG